MRPSVRQRTHGAATPAFEEHAVAHTAPSPDGAGHQHQPVLRVLLHAADRCVRFEHRVGVKEICTANVLDRVNLDRDSRTVAPGQFAHPPHSLSGAGAPIGPRWISTPSSAFGSEVRGSRGSRLRSGRRPTRASGNRCRQTHRARTIGVRLRSFRSPRLDSRCSPWRRARRTWPRLVR